MAKRRKKGRRRSTYQLRSSRKRSNPLFPKQGRGLTRKILWLFALILLVWGIGFLLFAQRLDIRTVNVEASNLTLEKRAQAMAEEFLDTRRWVAFKQSNIFVFDRKSLRQRIGEEFRLEELSVKKDYFTGINVVLVEKLSNINLITQNRRFLLDGAGIAIKEIPQVIELEGESLPSAPVPAAAPEGEHPQEDASQNVEQEIEPGEGSQEEALPTIDFLAERMIMGEDEIIIYDLGNTQVHLDQKVLDSDWIDKLIAIVSHVKLLTPARVQYLGMPDISQGNLILNTSEGWEILFDLTKDTERQLENLELVYKDKFQDDRQSLEYIDLRFDERVYFK